jgi:poly(A) polymerase
MSVQYLSYLSALLPLDPQPVFLVGGSVRDLLNGSQDLKDIDLVMPAGSGASARKFADAIGGSFFVLDEERGMTRVVKHEAGEMFQFDFADFIGPDLQADLSRRDFTINAMALDLRQYLIRRSLDAVVDPFGGRKDLQRMLIRAVRPDVLDEDPLRLLRAVRIAAQLGFAIDLQTADDISARAGRVTDPSPERVRDELFQIFSLRGGGTHLSLMDSLGLLLPLFPELAPLKDFTPGAYHTYDVLTHSIKTAGYVDGVLDGLPGLSPGHARTVLAHLEEPLEQGVPRKAALRFGCLLHDIAKPETFTEADGHVRFHGHDSRGAEKAKDACRRLRLSRDTEALVSKIIRYHMRLFQLAGPGGPSKHALFRYCRDLGDDLPESLLLALADSRSTFELVPAEKFTDTKKIVPAVLEYYYGTYLKTEERPLVTGDDLIAHGLVPGPRFREILDALQEKQAEGAISTREEALEQLNAIKKDFLTAEDAQKGDEIS